MTTVFVPGCFDLLHAGHRSLIQRARHLGDYLVVGLNSDESVRRIKGEGRPVWSYERRAAAIRAMGIVDAIVAIRDDTPRSILQEMEPDVLCKGAQSDHTDGSEYAGSVVFLPLLHDVSTTGILEGMNNAGGCERVA